MARSDSVQELIESRINEIETWVEHGDTDIGKASTSLLQRKLGIGYSTYRKYKSDNVALKGAIATGKDKSNQAVEKALLNNCLGYKYYEEVATKVKKETRSPDGTVTIEEEVLVKPVKKYKCPYLAAQKFWLINRKTKAWSDDPNRVINDKKLTRLKEKEIESKNIL